MSTHHTIPWAPEPMGRRFWYLFRIVNVESPTSTVTYWDGCLLLLILNCVKKVLFRNFELLSHVSSSDNCMFKIYVQLSVNAGVYTKQNSSLQVFTFSSVPEIKKNQKLSYIYAWTIVWYFEQINLSASKYCSYRRISPLGILKDFDWCT